MYVQAIKLNRKKVIYVGLAALILLAVILLGNLLMRPQASSTVKLTGIKTETDRQQFLSSIGIKVKESPVDKAKIHIPDTFDLVYQNYNELQRRNGFDLSKYHGKTVDKWTYQAQNYEGAENDIVYVTLLIYQNKIIGGDINTARLDGFMMGLGGKE